MPVLITRASFESNVARSDCTDKIAVRNLAVDANSGTDVWGRQKRQRALISVTVTLRSGVASASSTDTVDASTVHYGILSKAILSLFQDSNSKWTPTSDLVGAVTGAIRAVAGPTSLYAIETDIVYVKGSMFGAGVEYATAVLEADKSYSTVLYLRDVNIPCLIGVNSNEREKKQPIVLNLWLQGINDQFIDNYANLENLLFEFISQTTFQTIESLLEAVIEHIRGSYLNLPYPIGDQVRVRIAKPHAVSFADAPAVEITRSL